MVYPNNSFIQYLIIYSPIFKNFYTTKAVKYDRFYLVISVWWSIPFSDPDSVAVQAS
jgi:hypothetical protein